MVKSSKQWTGVARLSLLSNVWTGCLASLVSVVCQSTYANALTDPVNSLEPTSSLEVRQDIATIPKIPKPAGKKPVTPVDCEKLRRFDRTVADYEPKDHFERYVVTLYQVTSPNTGYSLLNLFPNDVFWWIRLHGSVNVISVATALHEVNHTLDRGLTECNSGKYAYHLLGGAIYRTEHRVGFGDTPNIGILAKSLPESLKAETIGSRYPQYIVKNAANPSNDFAMLLEEFVAYIGGADFELSVVQSPSLVKLIPPEMTSINMNSGGMVDFMAYLVAYLKSLRTEHPKEYARLKSWPNMLAMIQQSWSSAEEILEKTYPHTIFANQGGRVSISLNSLSVAYSPEFLTELGKLGIAHKGRAAWDGTYLSSNR